jgi:Ni,Fe-hydrogenase I large subunit
VGRATGRPTWRTAKSIFNPVALGSRDVAQLGHAASAGTKRRAARSATGWRSKGRSIKNYQAVVPTTWNAGPRDAQGQRGAYEASLLNTPDRRSDAAPRDLRTIHSFDPCIACAVHVIDAKGARFTVPGALGYG